MEKLLSGKRGTQSLIYTKNIRCLSVDINKIKLMPMHFGYLCGAATLRIKRCVKKQSCAIKHILQHLKLISPGYLIVFARDSSLKVELLKTECCGCEIGPGTGPRQ